MKLDIRCYGHYVHCPLVITRRGKWHGESGNVSQNLWNYFNLIIFHQLINFNYLPWVFFGYCDRLVLTKFSFHQKFVEKMNQRYCVLLGSKDWHLQIWGQTSSPERFVQNCLKIDTFSAIGIRMFANLHAILLVWYGKWKFLPGENWLQTRQIPIWAGFWAEIEEHLVIPRLDTSLIIICSMDSLEFFWPYVGKSWIKYAK